MAEVEAVLNITKITTSLSQHENLYTGAFGGLIKDTTMAGLRSNTIHVIDVKRVTSSPHLPRAPIDVASLTDLGSKCRMRATLEGERRWCGNKEEELTGAGVIITERELVSSLLDLRTIGVPHLDRQQQQKALSLLETSYIKYATQAAKYNCESTKAREAKAQAEAAAALAEVAAAAAASSSSAPALAPLDQKPLISCGASYGANPWATSADEPDEEEPDEPPLTSVTTEEGYRSEFKKVWKAWSRLPVTWSDHYPDLKPPQGGGGYNLVADLMPLNVGPLYKKIIESDPEGRAYGKLPLMAECSTAQIGALNAESFCERVISCANLVVTDGNTLLDDEEVTMLTVLRMNREFMEYMRANHNAVSRQAFLTTVVDL